jgi:hypothetical protein
MSKNIQDGIGPKERRFISGRKKPLRTPPKTIIMCIDMAGTASDQVSKAMRSEVMGSSIATTVALYL